MTSEVRASASPGETRIAALRDGRLTDFAIWRPAAPDGVGDLHRGRIRARAPAMAGAFVAINSVDGTDGFLPDSEGAAGRGEGETVGVRVTRAAANGKGPRLTARLTNAEAALIGTGAPARILAGPTPLLRIAARHPDAAVLVDDGQLAATMRPAFGDRLTRVAQAFAPEIESEIAALADSVVALSGGARLIISPTPALVAIDIDTATATASRQRKRSFQRQVNAALLPELARQIRLRELGGAILVDFAGLSAKDRGALAQPFAAALAADPVRPRLLGFTALGFAEILRPRVQPPLHEVLSGPYAAGLAALRTVAREAAAQPSQALALRAAPAVVSALRADVAALADLAGRTGRDLILRSDPALQPNTWVIEDSDDRAESSRGRQRTISET